jgi:hypothetical protein
VGLRSLYLATLLLAVYGYHATLLAPFCFAAVKSFFATP